MMNRTRAGTARCGRRSALLLAASVAFLGACDLDVSSPSTLEDHELDTPAAVNALFRGVQGDLANAAAGPPGSGGTYLAGALLTDELASSGVWFAHRQFSDGLTNDSWREVQDIWAAASQARYTAESFVTRMEKIIAMRPVEDQTDDLEEGLPFTHARAMNIAGFANRIMGDAFCNAVIDGGPLQDHTEFYRRAEQHFSRAVELATQLGRDTILQVAYAGRAQARMMLGDWQGAVADAGVVGTDLVFQQEHRGTTARPRENNFIRVSILFTNAETTVWGTPFADWGRRDGTTTGDPRATWDIPLLSGQPRESGDRRRPFWRQTKYVNYGDNIALVKGTEMRLIEAEARLRAGDVGGAVAKINEVRQFRNSPLGGLAAADRTLPMVSATTTEAAWELLMRERGIELWLEGRRLPDLRRWAQSPGYVPTQVVRQAVGDSPDDDVRRNVLAVDSDLCIPVSRTERRTNPNIGL